jgi:mannose-6-phosphate isomerase-like protein (cupin superfamily)
VQHLHSHTNEQAYYILSGSGTMTVDEESKRIAAGDCIFIPSYAGHGLKNDSDVKLVYISAASPSFTQEECRILWPLFPHR